MVLLRLRWELGRSARLLFSLLACSLILPTLSFAQTSSATEDDVRAAMVSHLLLFVDWPQAKMDPAHPQFHVCLLGADPIAPVLETALHGTATLPASILFSRVTVTDKLDSCHLLYIGTGARGNYTRLLPQLMQASVLIVSERPVDSVAGEIIGLPLEENRVRIEVNLAAAQNSKITVSSRLLSLASLVRR